MQRKLILPLMGLCLLAILAAPGIAASFTAEEADLAATAYEMNRDALGRLYLSGYQAGEVWRVDAATGNYTRYTVGLDVVDARPDSQGDIWFTDGGSLLSRINTGASPPTITTWDFYDWAIPPDVYSLWGLAFDSSGNLWITENFGSTSLLYRLNPGSGELCGYDVPDGSYSYYVLAQDSAVWLVNWYRAKAMRFEPASSTSTRWQLPTGGQAEGLALDGNGHLWFADAWAGTLGRLEPDANQATTFALPTGSTPHMVAVDGAQIWYTEEAARSVGVLDPAAATGTTTAASKRTDTGIAATCASLGAGSTSQVTATTGALAWSQNDWNTLVDSGGWTVYELPASSQPFGLALEGGQTWVTDPGRQKLARSGSSGGLAAPALAISADGDNALLTWNAVTGATAYEVWRSEDPYFTPGDAGSELRATETDTDWTDSGVLADLLNYTYVVRATDGGQVSPASNRVGEFTFTVVKGSAE